MKRLNGLLALFTLFGLLTLVTACGGGGIGGGGSVSGMAGEWVYSESGGGATNQYVLDISGSDSGFSGDLLSVVSAAGREFTNRLASFSGERSGSNVTIDFGGLSYDGTLSGRRLTFDEFITSVAIAGSITFTKR